jgi:ATP-dependent RNA helicase DDX56/DBP9
MTEAAAAATSPAAPPVEFASLGLDERVLRAVYRQGLRTPTLVQGAALPLALAGRDIVARARTGSGKTHAYAIPIVQSLLAAQSQQSQKRSPAAGRGAGDVGGTAVHAVVLVPTRELCGQVSAVLDGLLAYTDDLRVISLGGEGDVTERAPLIASGADVIVSTPGRLLEHVNAQHVNLQQLRVVVIDEADLVMSYGYDDEVRELVRLMPSVVQGFLMSATLTPEIEVLKQLVLHKPAVISLDQAPDPNAMPTEALAHGGAQLREYCLRCPDDNDKFLVLYALIRLRVIPGRAIFFVNTIDRCFKLKLFLERFTIKAAVMNSELPQNSRAHILDGFNKGMFDFLIATDELVAEPADDESDGDGSGSEKAKDDGEGTAKPTARARGKRASSAKREYGVSRGVDFKDVQTVVNFDFPETAKSYVHRIGRTARGLSSGTALSFVVDPDSTPGADVEPQSGGALDGELKVLDAVERQRVKAGTKVEPYLFNATAIQGFRYRVEDVLRSVSKIAIRDARVAELRNEILNSEKLKAHFEENPVDAELLQHDAPLQQQAALPYLRHVPDYLVPEALRPAVSNQVRSRGAPRGRGGRKRKADPLKTFAAPRGSKLHKALHPDLGDADDSMLQKARPNRGRGGARGRGRGRGRGRR